MKIIYSDFNTTFGQMIIGVFQDKICLLDFANRKSINKILNRIQSYFNTSLVKGYHPLMKIVENQLLDYFDEELKKFTVPIIMAGTEFQKCVWSQLLKIPYGQTTTYGKLSKELQSSPRAIGRANGSNSIAIIIPCHRVIGADGSLTGYGGGISRKRKLIQLEKNNTISTLEKWFPSAIN